MKIIQVVLLFVFTPLALHAGAQFSGAGTQGPVQLMALAQAGLQPPVYHAIINLNNRTVAQRNGLLMAVQDAIQAFAQPGAARDIAIDAAVAANGGANPMISNHIKAVVDMAHPNVQ